MHLEIFDGDAPAPVGTMGDVVLTSLRNRAMPLVRYRVGDRARLVASPCRCGLPHPVIADLQARTGDFFVGADGRRHHASELVSRLGAIYASPEADGTRQVQFEQLANDSWRVWLERRVEGHATARLQERLAALVREVAGGVCSVEFAETAELPRERGKFRYYKPVVAA